MRNYLIIVVLTAFCLAFALFTMPIRSSPDVGDYDPWVDLDDDGVIDGNDIIQVGRAFGKAGTLINKTSLLQELHTARTHNETYSTIHETISGYGGLTWQNMPGMSVQITLETEAILMIMFSCQARTEGTWQEMYVRALVDSVPANPSTGVVLIKSNDWAALSFTFCSSNVSAGFHSIRT